MSEVVKFERELVFLEEDFPLDVFILEDHPDYPPHVHDFSVIVIVSHGHGINVVGGEEFPVKAGDVFVHHGGRPHGYRETSNLGVINVIYDQTLLQKVCFDVAGLPGYQSLFVVEPAMLNEGRYERHLTLGMTELAKAKALAEAIEKELFGDAPRRGAVRFEDRYCTKSGGMTTRREAAGYRFMAMAQFMALVGLAASYDGNYGDDFRVETSETLSGAWATETEGVNVVVSGDDVTYTFPAGPVKKFARLVVTGP